MGFKESIKSLNDIESTVLPHYKASRDIKLFYSDFRRRVELLNDILNLVPKGARVLDAGSAPGYISLSLKFLGYEVYSLDVNPEPYKRILEERELKLLNLILKMRLFH